MVPRRIENLSAPWRRVSALYGSKRDRQPRARFPVFALTRIPRRCQRSGIDMQVMYPWCAGLDLGKDVVVAAARVQDAAGVSENAARTG